MTALPHSHPRRTVEDILAAYNIPLPRFDTNGSGYVPCPQCSHSRKNPANKRKPVLHVTIRDDGVIWFCNHCPWRGGEFFETRSEMFVAAKYDYTDEAGTLLFQTLRISPKDFRQRRSDGKGGWIWNIQGVRRVLYRLPDLVASRSAGDKVVILVEGEKDVDRLRALGAVATCNPMGAGKWRDEYSEALRGFETALVVADKDDAGWSHAQAVAASVSQVVPHVKLIELPGERVKDASDFIAADGTLAEIFHLADAAAVWTPPALPVEDPNATETPTASGHSATSAAPSFPVMADAAYHGLAGDIVRALEPHTESDPVAILVQVLACFGNIVGRDGYYAVEADRHQGNIFAVLVGDTAKARKGTSGGRVRAIFKEVSEILIDERWIDSRIKSGLSSGEGLINEVRDAVEGWNRKEQCFETADPGVTDKRLLVDEREFASALAVMERSGNTLSPVIRNAWDGGPLGTITKNSPLKATGAHISIIGHVTEEELRARLTRTDAASGFGNRFLFLCVRRSKLLPFGGALDAATLHALSERLARAVEFAKAVGRVQMTPAARDVWASIYADLSAAQPGLLGAITARAEAQVVRLALLYALNDSRDEIDVWHLKAALAVWEYAEASAVRIFGDSLGDPVADEILRALQQAGTAGLTRTAIRDLFGRNQSGDRIGLALRLLLTKGRARTEQRQTGGRPVEAWFANRKGG